MYSKIIGTSYLPNEAVSNDELAARLAKDGGETSDEWIRHAPASPSGTLPASNQTSSDLAMLPQSALKWRAWAFFDLIIVATTSPT